MADDDPHNGNPPDPVKDGKDEKEMAARTFFTSIDAQPESKKKEKDVNRFRTLESTTAGNRIVEYHQELTNLANSLDTRMSALLKEHEKDFFLSYKTHMYTVQKEIKILRMKADAEEAKTREDSKIKALEGELDWFMTEALRLDELCKSYKKEVDKWKSKAEALDEDRRFLEDQIKGAKRQNKILKAASERARSSAYSALMATAKDSGHELVALPATANQETQWRPLSGGQNPAAGSAMRRAMEARARTPEAMTMAMPKGILNSSGKFGGSSPNGALPLGYSGLSNEAEERYVEAVAHLKESIVREQQNVRILQATRATSYSKKSELEEFFLKCIDEARKELTRKRHVNMYREKTEKERVLEAMLNNEDVLVCLYEKLFPHRTGIARSLGAPPGSAEEKPQAAIGYDDYA